MPKVSIITTFYNRERYLSRSVESVLAQTFEDLELILFNDGSTDDSLAIAETFARQDKRVKLASSFHVGRATALVEAASVASGEYLGLVDSDDWIEFNCIEELVKVLDANSSTGLAYSNCLYADADDNILGSRKQSQIPYSRDRLLVDFIAFHLRLFRRELFELCGGFDSSYEYAEDYDLTLRLSEITQMEFVPSAVYFCRRHSESMGAEHTLEQAYWSLKAIRASLARTKDKRRVRVSSKTRFVLN